MKRRCLGCMEQYEDKFRVCPHCGYVVGTSAEEAIYMPPGTLLHDRYIVGRVIGSGGFGVTYLGWDGRLEQKVAIKEYLPGEFSTRMPGSSLVTVFEGDKGQQFNDGMRKLIEESKRLSKFQNEPGIVKIFDSFEENCTAYIVMEYLNGMTLEKYLEHVGVVSEDEAVSMLMPVMASLQTVHEAGLLHRDIAPDNIFLTRTGEVKLIDFGAARYATTSHSRSLTVIVKPGYSPAEQYRSNGEQGPHTDIHALAGTLYRMITGVRPADAMERYSTCETKGRDLLLPLHKFDKNISKNRENAILNGMNVRVEDRTANVAEFISELNSDKPVKRRYGKIKKIDIFMWPLWMKILIPVAVAAVAVCGILFSTVLAPVIKHAFGTGVTEGYVMVPEVIGLTHIEAEEKLKSVGLQPKYGESKINEYFEGGTIIQQNPNSDMEKKEGSWVYIIMSRGTGEIQYDENGNVKLNVYSCLNADEDTIRDTFKDQNLILTFKKGYSDRLQGLCYKVEGCEDGQSLPEGAEIVFWMSEGPEPKTIGNFVGMAYKENTKSEALQYAVKFAKENGFNIDNFQFVPVVVKDDRQIGKVIYQSRDEAGKDPISATESVSPMDVVYLGFGVKGNETLLSVPEIKQHTPYKNAKKMLSEAGFKNVGVKEVYDNSVAKGNVIDVSKTSSKLTSESQITIYVSKGPHIIEVIFEVEGEVYDKKEIPHGSKYEFPKKPKLKDEGMEITGWVTENGKPINEGNKVTVESGSITLKAKTEPKEFPVTLYYQYNNKTEVIDATYGKKYGTELPIKLERTDGYTFCGWYYTKNPSDMDSPVTQNTKVSETGKHELYASWKANVVGVTYKDTDGKEIGYDPLNVGDKYNLPTKAPTGYKISGYYIEGKGTAITSSSKVTETTDHTVCVEYKLISYTASWSTGTGYSITVKRTSSPNAGASIGVLNSGATIYYGDVLSVIYTASKGYSISSKGPTSIFVTGDVTSKNIYAIASTNSYTYTIKYVSTNGTDLGSSSATYGFGTNNTISAPDKSGYITPPAQSVKWDATSKTITFRYTPKSVATSQRVKSGEVWYYTGNNDLIYYDVDLQYRNRTANSVQVRVVWTNTIIANSYYSYYQAFNVSEINGIGVYDTDYQIVAKGAWASASSSARSSTAYSNWYTIPVSSKATTLTVGGVYWRGGREDEPKHYKDNINIPAY